MGLWRQNSSGEPERFIPSEYVFDNMDSEDAHRMLGRLLDLMWETGKLSDREIIEVIGYPGLTTSPAIGNKERGADDNAS